MLYECGARDADFVVTGHRREAAMPGRSVQRAAGRSDLGPWSRRWRASVFFTPRA